MKSPHRSALREMKFLCSEIRPEDGLNPFELKKALRHQDALTRQGPSPVSCTRTRQYCKAVQRALEGGLSDVCGDERLKDLLILTVEPLQAGGSNLLVVATAPGISSLQSIQTLEQQLQKASGLLRSVIAAEIQRKRTPHLTFRVVPET